MMTSDESTEGSHAVVAVAPSGSEHGLAGEGTSLRDALPGADDPDVARVRALVEARLLGLAPVPARIGRFALIERIAEGGMGVVFAAYDAELDRPVAVKLLRTDRDDPALRSRIGREAQAMARLSHPNVAQVYEVGEHQGRTFIAMELVRGRSLRAVAAERQRPWHELVRLYEQAGRGLAAAHAAGLVHRDFKPDNAVLGEDVSRTPGPGRVRVVDFGLARAEAVPDTLEGPELDRSHTATATASSVVAGTPAYMPPEQLRGEPVDAAADQFALCVALYEALYGQRPFVAETRAELLAAILEGRVHAEPPGTHVPRAVRAVLLRGLAAEPARRFASMSALVADLERARRRVARRRWTIALAILLGAALAGAAWWARDRAEHMAECAAQGDDAIAELWNEPVRTRMPVLLSGGDARAGRVVASLDRQADGWARARAETCADVEVRGVWDADTAERSLWCLEQRRLALQAAIAMLEHAGPAADPATWIDTLPGPQRCRDAVALPREPVPPQAVREDVRALLGRVAEAEALVGLGQPARALQVAQPALLAAGALDWSPLSARAHVVVATALAAVGDRAAEPALVEAYYAAAELGDPAGTFAWPSTLGAV
jgi:predicted Ser/Thr protein kinase